MRSALLFILLLFCTTGAMAQLALPLHVDTVTVEEEQQKLKKEDSLKRLTYINSILNAGKDTVFHSLSPEKAERKDGRIRSNYKNIPSYIVFLFILAFILLSVIIIADRDLISQLFGCILNPSQLTGLYNEGRFGFNFLNFVLDFFFVLSVSVLVQFVFFQFHPEYFGWIAVFTLAAYFIKIMFVQMCGYLFFERKVAISHSLFDLLFTRLLGLVLLPIVFCVMYQTVYGLVFLMTILFITTLFMYTIWLIILLLKMKLDGTGGIFYLMLYLCAVEIFPLLIILKNFLI